MPILGLFVCCRHVIVDAVTNELSLIGILDTVSPANQPRHVTPVASVAVWHATPEDIGRTFRQKVEVTVPGRGPVFSETEFMFVRPSIRIMSQFVGIPMPQGGCTWRIFLTEPSSAFRAEPSGTFITWP